VSHQAQAPYSTTYMYGEQSLAEVSTYLRERLPDEAIVIAPKDVGYLLQDRWRYIELVPDPRRDFDRPHVQALVMRTNDYYGNTIRSTPEIAESLSEHFKLDTTIGGFQVWFRYEP
ncbi:hypothetical protein, partial [Roseiflexus sp.]|uniref:hypothetical protein n=1 Tax=Roseiflexus sp. TaxID=2562120 RepID=UPI00398B1335